MPLYPPAMTSTVCPYSTTAYLLPFDPKQLEQLVCARSTHPFPVFTRTNNRVHHCQSPASSVHLLQWPSLSNTWSISLCLLEHCPRPGHVTALPTLETLHDPMVSF